MCIVNKSDNWSKPENDEQVFVDMMVTDMSTSILNIDERNITSERRTRRVPKTTAGKRASVCKKGNSANSKSNAVEVCKKKQKGKKSQRTSLTSKGFKRHFAKHNYHDYAWARPSQFDVDQIKASRGGVHNPFPVILHSMMEDAAKKGFSNIISWQPHGRAFLIHQPKVFVSEILPNYFKHSKLSSFQRQLSLYGFVRLTQESDDRGAYYHECFLRGRPFLCSKINRTRVKGTWVRTSSSPESEPNFYSMPPVVDVSRVGLPCISDSSTASSCDDDSAMEDRDKVVYSASPVSVDSEASKSLNFLDILHSIDTSDLQIFADEPSSDAGLRPPPAFPTHVIGPNQLEPMKNLDQIESAPITLKASKLPSVHVPSLATLHSRPQASASTDDELAQFLIDVDLDTDFDTEDVIQLVTV